MVGLANSGHVSAQLLALEAYAERAGAAMACAYSSSAEYDAALIAEPPGSMARGVIASTCWRPQDGGDTRHWRCAAIDHAIEIDKQEHERDATGRTAIARDRSNTCGRTGASRTGASRTGAGRPEAGRTLASRTSPVARPRAKSRPRANSRPPATSRPRATARPRAKSRPMASASMPDDRRVLDGIARLVVNGTNVLHAIRRSPTPLPAAALIGRLRAIVPPGVVITVVLDGSPEHGLVARQVASGVEVRYAGRTTADELIAHLLVVPRK